MRRLRSGTLVAVDGVDGSAIVRRALSALAAIERPLRGGVSRWDASGIFNELMTQPHAEAPSARMLLLLYAADLAFRLRWEIRPALAENRTAIAAPYVDTAIAFGRAAGLRAAWLNDLFRFAPRPGVRHLVDMTSPGTGADGPGFVEFGCAHRGGAMGVKRQSLRDRVARHLRQMAKGRRVSAPAPSRATRRHESSRTVR
jgi:hypothetical protein